MPAQDCVRWTVGLVLRQPRFENLWRAATLRCT